jgi:hypothetical protein
MSTEYQGPQAIALEEIDAKLRPASEMRAGLSIEALEQYARTLAQLPPVKLMWDRKNKWYWVVDGAHTITAFSGIGQSTVQAVVAEGDYLQAFRAAAQENKTHGVQITGDDKRARVKQAAKMLPGLVKDWPWSARRLAQFCGVGIDLVIALKVIPVSQVSGTDTRQAPATGQGGKVYLPARQPTVAASPTPPVEPNGQAASTPATNGQPAPADPPPASSTSPAKQGPEPFDVLCDIIKKNRLMIGSIEAEDTPQRKGWGGFRPLVSTLTRSQQKQLHTHLVDVVESLQEWIDHLGEVVHEVRADKD